MPDALIICGNQQVSPAKAKTIVRLDLSPDAHPTHRVDFDPEKMRAKFVDELPDVVADALELAVYVFTADRLVKRGSSSSPQIGSGWQRRLMFQVPVRCPDLWRRRDVIDALVDVLTFLSGDELSFEFTQAITSQSLEPFLGFGDPAAQVVQPDLVMLFSGGLDSLAGVASEVLGLGKSAVLVTHQSSNALINRQNCLARAIEMRCALPRQVYYAPVRIRRGTEEPVEYSQRLRSFLFASLGLAYAQMFGRNSVQLFENGITSFNLPVADHILGTRASRTTHPRVLAGFSRLFSLLLDTPVKFENQLLWQTKADVVDAIVRNGCKDLIAMTTSCAGVRNLSMTGVQCGVCSQCVERRLATIAAGIDPDQDAGADYVLDMFRDPLKDAQHRTMIIGHVQRAQRFARMSAHAFLSNYGQVFKAISSIDGSPQEVAGRIFNLHRRYGQTVVKVVDEQLKGAASLDGFAQLSADSLLGLIATPISRVDEFFDPIEKEVRPSVQAMLSPPARELSRVVLGIDRQRKQVTFDNGPILTRKSYKLVAKLADQRRQDLEAGLDKTEFRFVTSAQLMEDVPTKTEQSLRRIVMRTRRSLEQQFEEAIGFTLDTNDVIESRNWEGYRLNPWVLLAQPNQIRPAEEKSRFESRSVTSLEPSH